MDQYRNVKEYSGYREDIGIGQVKEAVFEKRNKFGVLKAVPCDGFSDFQDAGELLGLRDVGGPVALRGKVELTPFQFDDPLGGGELFNSTVQLLRHRSEELSLECKLTNKACAPWNEQKPVH